MVQEDSQSGWTKVYSINTNVESNSGFWIKTEKTELFREVINRANPNCRAEQWTAQSDWQTTPRHGFIFKNFLDSENLWFVEH